MFDYISLKRHSFDKTVNSYGNQLLELCSANDMFILKGRIENDKSTPGLTCKGASTVDYFISSVSIIQYVTALTVQPFSCLYSNVHNTIELHLEHTETETIQLSPNNTNNNNAKQQVLWDKD